MMLALVEVRIGAGTRAPRRAIARNRKGRQSAGLSV
jgi:hypothetical protein